MRHKIVAIVALFAAISSTALYSQNRGWLSVIFSGGTGFSGIEPKKPTDAVSGASRWGGRGGVHAEVGISGQFIETGLDYSYLTDDLTYTDAGKSIDGTRNFVLQSVTLPIMYNFHFFNRNDGNPNLVCGIGLFGSYFPYMAIGETGILSNYDLMNWAAGPCLRISCFPFEIEDKYFLGLYLDIRRSINHLYTDGYFNGTKPGDVGILDFGVSLKLQ
jgi:hypothetical protein